MACLILIPLGILSYFIISLRRFISAKKDAEKVPLESQNYSLMTRRLNLIVSAVLLAFCVLMAVCAVALLSGAISFM